ncbi:hypothetical protein I9E57_004753 [Salmonella enterica]|nr:hypothetical protein [Salmonella enterica]
MNSKLFFYYMMQVDISEYCRPGRFICGYSCRPFRTIQAGWSITRVGMIVMRYSSHRTKQEEKLVLSGDDLVESVKVV